MTFPDDFFEAAFNIPGSYHEWISEGSPFAFLSVTGWPRWMRRLFVLTLPLACLLWLAAAILAVLIVVAAWLTVVIGFGGLLTLLLCVCGIAYGLFVGCRSLWK